MFSSFEWAQASDVAVVGEIVQLLLSQLSVFELFDDIPAVVPNRSADIAAFHQLVDHLVLVVGLPPKGQAMGQGLHLATRLNGSGVKHFLKQGSLIGVAFLDQLIPLLG